MDNGLENTNPTPQADPGMAAPGMGGGSVVEQTPPPAVPSDPLQAPAESVPQPVASDATQPASGDLSAQMDSLLNTTAAPAASAAVAEVPKKKSKMPLLVAIIAGVLLIGGGVFGAFWLVKSQMTPEKIVLKAVTNMISQKSAMKLTGEFSLHGQEMAWAGISSVSIISEGKSGGMVLPTATDTTIRIVTTDDKTYEIKTGGVFLIDGVFYFRMDGLTKMLEENIPDEEIEETIELLLGILEEVEGTWWKFAIEDFGLPEEINDAYDCMIGAMVSLDSDNARADLVKLYTDWPLFDVTEAGVKKDSYEGYRVSLNTKNAAGFINGVAKTDHYKSFARCLVPLGIDALEPDEVDADKLEMPEGEMLPTFTFFIDTKSYELKELTMTTSSDGVMLGGGWNIEFIDAAKIVAPEGARPVMEMVEAVVLRICRMMDVGDDVDLDECMEQITENLLPMFTSQFGLTRADGMPSVMAGTLRKNVLAQVAAD